MVSNSRIVIVEDNETEAYTLKLMLERLKYQVVGVFSTGEELLERYYDLKPDLVLMDINLAGKLDGIEVGKEICSDSDIPIIYLTADSDIDTFTLAAQNKPTGYITKPYNVKNLEFQVALAINTYKNPKDINKNIRKHYRTILECEIVEADLQVKEEALLVRCTNLLKAV